MKLVLIDTNVLLAVAQFRVDVFAEVEKCLDFPARIAVLQGTVAELRKIAQTQQGKFRRAAALALVLLKKRKVPVVSSSQNVDQELLKHSREGVLVLTQDRALKRQLQKPYLTLRQRKLVVMVK